MNVARPGHVFVCGMSRSGTTLLATVLDAHPGISMGYELLPGPLPAPAVLAALIEEAAGATDGSPRATGNRLKRRGHAAAGVFVKRAARARVDAAALREIVDELARAGIGAFDGAASRTALALAVVERKMALEGTRTCGFKIGAGLARDYLERFPDGAIVFIARDPRDVVASHRARGFDETIPQIARTWCRFTAVARELTADGPDRCALVLYEDLVRRPEPVLRSACAALGLDFAPEMLEFFDSKASVFEAGQRHVNAESLAQDFFTTSVDRWREDLAPGDVAEIERRCGAGMVALGYACAHPPRKPPLAERLRGLVRRKP